MITLDQVQEMKPKDVCMHKVDELTEEAFDFVHDAHEINSCDLCRDLESTYDLIWGHESPIIIAELNKGQFYTIAVDRKSNDMVDVYLDGDWLREESAIGTGTPDFLLIGDGNGVLMSGQVQIDFVNVGVWGDFAVPGDLDGDDYVDENDVAELTTKWGLRSIDAGWDAAYDLDGSGQIGFGDYLLHVQGLISETIVNELFRFGQVQAADIK